MAEGQQEVIDAADHPAKAAGVSSRAAACKVFLVGVLTVLVVLVVYLALASLVLDKIAKVFGDWADDASDEERVGVVAAFAAASTINNILPGNAHIWNILICYIFDWGGLVMITLSRLVGLAIAFQVVRLLWKRCDGCTCCPACCRKPPPGTRKQVTYMLAMTEVVEDWPLKVLFLLLLSPVPHQIVTYVVAAKVEKVSLLTFSIANLLSCIKLPAALFFASRADNVSDIMKGSLSDAPSAIFTIGGIAVVVLSMALIGYLTGRKLRELQAESRANRAGDEEPKPRPDAGED